MGLWGERYGLCGCCRQVMPSHTTALLNVVGDGSSSPILTFWKNSLFKENVDWIWEGFNHGALLAFWLWLTATNKLCEDSPCLLFILLQGQLPPSGNGLHWHLKFLFSVCILVFCPIWGHSSIPNLASHQSWHFFRRKNTSAWHLTLQGSLHWCFLALHLQACTCCWNNILPDLTIACSFISFTSLLKGHLPSKAFFGHPI